jgi:cell division protein FtsB
MQIKTDQYKQKALRFTQRLSDVRFVGQLVFAVIVLLITWSGIKSIQTNYVLQKQISTLKQQNTVQQLENNNLTLQNQYFNSNQYLELAARQNFGLAATGEKEVVVPASVAMAYTVDVPTIAAESTTPVPQAAYQKNFQSWVDFFLHRQNTN